MVDAKRQAPAPRQSPSAFARFDAPALRRLLRPAGHVRDCRKFKQGSSKFDQPPLNSRNYLIGDVIDRYTEIPTKEDTRHGQDEQV